MTGPAVRWPASDKQKYIERKIVLYAYDTSHAVSVAPITCIVLNIHHLVVPCILNIVMSLSKTRF